ncbi:hypothetical protein CDL15_Pgr004439 [Punica granatum]|nr:hypothetical protein CDL15_Pgr004439 [Punica granatum]
MRPARWMKPSQNVPIMQWPRIEHPKFPRPLTKTEKRRLQRKRQAQRLAYEGKNVVKPRQRHVPPIKRVVQKEPQKEVLPTTKFNNPQCQGFCPW